VEYTVYPKVPTLHQYLNMSWPLLLYTADPNIA